MSPTRMTTLPGLGGDRGGGGGTFVLFFFLKNLS